MNRIACAQTIEAALEPNDIVICSLGSVNRSWRSVNPIQASYFCSDPMGISLAIALGMALAMPHRRVVALCGDGDAALGLSTLVTIAGAAVANLSIMIFNNRRYETGGGQALANPALDFALVAQGAGLGFARTVTDEAALKTALPELLAQPGTGLLALAIDAEPLGYSPPLDISQAEERALFMRRLGEIG